MHKWRRDAHEQKGRDAYGEKGHIWGEGMHTRRRDTQREKGCVWREGMCMWGRDAHVEK